MMMLWAWIAGLVTGCCGGVALGYLWRSGERRSRHVEIGRPWLP